ncbi:putative RNase [Carex littledalei]|uniref:Putative RNase n=1 Tax=Carex littledalei TaxID=544730 RepID=A0A833V805_9POAL|nr:putative RNase [Carex littledalei]
MEEGSDYYVVRKGNTVAVYKNLSDCQAQVSSSVLDAAVSVYKGRAWSKETEGYLSSHGLKNPLYTIDASELNKDLFGALIPCSFQDVVGSSSGSNTDFKRKTPVSGFVNNFKDMALCILNFDGGAKGNPGKGGAGALLKTEDGRVICRLSEGLGVVTNNVAEYKALLLGLRYALIKGFKRIDVRGDSMLVVMQVQGKWKLKHKDMIELCKKVNEIKKSFTYFNIQHVRREFNSDADHQANLAIDLRDGQVSEVLGDGC